MSETDRPSAAGPELRGSDRLATSKDGSGAGAGSELRRQMEAAKLRMKKYHAVYGQTGHPVEEPTRTNSPEDQ